MNVLACDPPNTKLPMCIGKYYIARAFLCIECCKCYEKFCMHEIFSLAIIINILQLGQILDKPIAQTQTQTHARLASTSEVTFRTIYFLVLLTCNWMLLCVHLLLLCPTTISRVTFIFMTFKPKFVIICSSRIALSPEISFLRNASGRFEKRITKREKKQSKIL